MRLTTVLNKAQKFYSGRGEGFNYWKRFIFRIQQTLRGSVVYKPIESWVEMGNKKVWYCDESPPYSQWLQNAQMDKEMPLVWPNGNCNIFLDNRKYCVVTLSNKSASHVEEGVLLGIDNALLDITIVTDHSLLKRFDLKPNNAILAESKHEELFKIICTDFEPAYLPGGATQNSIRVAQWLLQKPKATTFFGSVGNDEFGKILKLKAESVGVNVRYKIVDNFCTGRCAAIITGENRSLVTDLGAAARFDPKYLDDQQNWKLVEKAKFFYIGGFFLPVGLEAALKLLKHAHETNKTVVMNLHATFLCHYFADQNLMQYIDYLFGNVDEAKALAKLMGFNYNSLNEMAMRTSMLPKLNKSRKRMVIFTQGKDPIVVAHGDKVTEYQVKPVNHMDIKDTNGCGDAFVGGFLAQLVQGKPFEECIRCGFYASRVVIRYFGCNYPEKPDFE